MNIGLKNILTREIFMIYWEHTMYSSLFESIIAGYFTYLVIKIYL